MHKSRKSPALIELVRYQVTPAGKRVVTAVLSKRKQWTAVQLATEDGLPLFIRGMALLGGELVSLAVRRVLAAACCARAVCREQQAGRLIDPRINGAVKLAKARAAGKLHARDLKQAIADLSDLWAEWLEFEKCSKWVGGLQRKPAAAARLHAIDSLQRALKDARAWGPAQEEASDAGLAQLISLVPGDIPESLADQLMGTCETLEANWHGKVLCDLVLREEEGKPLELPADMKRDEDGVTLCVLEVLEKAKAQATPPRKNVGGDTFESDDLALDWLDELERSRSLRVVKATLSELDECDDVVMSTRIAAACEVAAALLGKPSEGLPNSLQAWVQKYSHLDMSGLATLAAKALKAAVREMKERWEELEVPQVEAVPRMRHLAALQRRLSKLAKAELENEPSSAWRRELRYRSGSSDKFWTIAVDGRSYTVRYGRTGTNGRSLSREFASAAAAAAAAETLVQQKRKKGYL